MSSYAETKPTIQFFDTTDAEIKERQLFAGAVARGQQTNHKKSSAVVDIESYLSEGLHTKKQATASNEANTPAAELIEQLTKSAELIKTATATYRQLKQDLNDIATTLEKTAATEAEVNDKDKASWGAALLQHIKDNPGLWAATGASAVGGGYLGDYIGEELAPEGKQDTARLGGRLIGAGLGAMIPDALLTYSS